MLPSYWRLAPESR